MYSLLVTPILIFPLISVFGLYAVSNLMVRTGHYQIFVTSLRENPRLLPDGMTPVQTLYTGLMPLDSFLANLQFTIVPVVDGSTPALSLLGFHWAGVLLAVFTVMLVESLRMQRARDLILFTIFGLAIQYFGYFLAMPIYCYIHLLSSGKIINEQTRMESSAYASLETALHAVPVSLIAGYVFASVVMCLPIYSGQSRQFAVAFWQNFPAWITVVQISVVWAWRGQPRASEVSCTSHTTATAQAEEFGKTIKQLYKVTGLFSALIHIIGLMPIGVATMWPEGFSSVNMHSLQATDFFLPPRWDSDIQVSGMVEGSWNFLRYDYYIGTAAALLWAAFLSYDSKRFRVARRRSLGEWVLKTIISVLFLGPGSTIVSLMIEREDDLLEISKKANI